MIILEKDQDKNAKPKPNGQQIANYFSPIKTGSNSEKFKNEIRQLLYSL